MIPIAGHCGATEEKCRKKYAEKKSNCHSEACQKKPVSYRYMSSFVDTFALLSVRMGIHVWT